MGGNHSNKTKELGMNATNIIIALIGAATAITGAFYTANVTSSQKVNDVNTHVQLVDQRQELQYNEITGQLADIKKNQDSTDDKIDSLIKILK